MAGGGAGRKKTPETRRRNKYTAFRNPSQQQGGKSSGRIKPAGREQCQASGSQPPPRTRGGPGGGGAGSPPTRREAAGSSRGLQKQLGVYGGVGRGDRTALFVLGREIAPVSAITRLAPQGSAWLPSLPPGLESFVLLECCCSQWRERDCSVKASPIRRRTLTIVPTDGRGLENDRTQTPYLERPPLHVKP